MPLVRLARLSARHRRLVLVLWAGVVIAGLASAPALFGQLTPEAGSVDSSEAQSAARLLWQAEPQGEEIYAVVDGRDVRDPGLRASVDRAVREISALPGVAEVATPYGGGGGIDRRAVARDGRALALAVRFDASPAGEAAVDAAAAALRGVDAPRVVVGGGPLEDEEMEEQAAADLARAELLSMPVVLVLLIVIFGGIVAAGLPVLIAVVGVAATLGSLLLISTVADVSVYAVNIVTMLGLGLAVDYALLIVSRFRGERALDGTDGDIYGDISGALERTYATAGRTVAFSGLTVAASLAGLLAFPDDFLRSMGFAALTVVLLDLLAALTLLPALLATVGSRIRPSRRPSRDSGVFVTVARLVRRRPGVVIVTVTALLALAATPFLGVRYADPDARSLPAESSSRQLVELAADRFEEGSAVDPVTVVFRGELAPAARAGLLDALGSRPEVRTVSVRDGVPGLTVIDAVPTGESQGPAAVDLVAAARTLAAPAGGLVTGDAAELVDYQSALASRIPLAAAVVLLATFVLLFLFTGSVVVPVKAVVLNILSLAASFGALVWVFQDGNLGWLVGTEALGSLSVTTPVLVLAIAFGLSMDYEVFLLGHIAEVYRRTGDNDHAVELGLQRTGRIVTAAALLMVVVFAGFVAGGFSPVKQVGLGLVLAIVVDATLVRMLLVPAVMTVMGRRNWWAPAPLRRWHDRRGLREVDSGSHPHAWSEPTILPSHHEAEARTPVR